jgi:hypothetical protein
MSEVFAVHYGAPDPTPVASLRKGFACSLLRTLVKNVLPTACFT